MYILLEIHVTVIVDKYRKYPKPMILQSHILRHNCNQTVVCNANNLFILPPYLFNESFTRDARKFPFDLNGKLTIAFLKVTHRFKDTQILVHSRGPRIRVLVLFHRWTCLK